jgi:hypothetical protein
VSVSVITPAGTTTTAAPNATASVKVP